MKTYYKVVRKLSNGARVSCFVPKISGFRKCYMANGETKNVDEGMVFTSEACAKSFIQSYLYEFYSDVTFEVWSCTVGSVGKGFPILKCILRYFKQNQKFCRSFMKDVRKGFRTSAQTNIPYGTVFGQNIKRKKHIKTYCGTGKADEQSIYNKML